MKSKIFFICILLSVISVCLHAQHTMGSWQSYLSYHNVTRTEPAGNIVYAIGNGDLFSYDKEDNSIRCYWKNNLLTDTDIAYIAYQNTYKTLVIVYNNANIDLLINDNEVINLPDYMNKNISYLKNVNNICFDKEYAYLSTSFGVIVLNLEKKEFTNTFILNKQINACALDGNTIYAASSEGLLTGLLTDNLLDANNWKKISDAVYHSITSYNNELIGNILYSGIYIINKSDYSYSQLAGGHYSYMNVYGDKLIAINDVSLSLFDNITKSHYLDHNLGIAHLSYQNGNYWAAGRENGLLGLKYNEANNTMQTTISSIIPNSPKRNLPFFLKFEGERLFVTGGGNTNNPQKGSIMFLENNTWYSFQEDGISEETGTDYLNIVSIVQDPTNTNHCFAASLTQGLYEFNNQKFNKLYTYTNSPLKVATPITKPEYFKNFVRVYGMAFDNKNNLWMLNCESEYPIHILKPNKEWISLQYAELKPIHFLENIIFDNNGWIWIVATKEFGETGIFCLDTKGTLEKTSDDKYIFHKKFTNQDGTLLDYAVQCMEFDREGAIWIGTNQGPLVINNPSRIFESNFYCTQIKVPRNDGTNLADFLLANDWISAIAVDGANRKWIGTDANGIYLLSPDGLETIHHFTAENSPLLSNSISSIAIHPRTGEVFIGTSKGLVSYQSDAAEGADSFNEENVYAYPNPVKSDYNGVITITGLVSNSDVKITNTVGKVITSGTSNGSIFTWNGRNSEGKRVPTGVYFVLAADENGKEGVTTKILFIK